MPVAVMLGRQKLYGYSLDMSGLVFRDFIVVEQRCDVSDLFPSKTMIIETDVQEMGSLNVHLEALCSGKSWEDFVDLRLVKRRVKQGLFKLFRVNSLAIYSQLSFQVV